MILTATLHGIEREVDVVRDVYAFDHDERIVATFVDGLPEPDLTDVDLKMLADELDEREATAIGVRLLSRAHPDALLAVQVLAVSVGLGAGIWGGWL